MFGHISGHRPSRDVGAIR